MGSGKRQQQHQHQQLVVGTVSACIYLTCWRRDNAS